MRKDYTKKTVNKYRKNFITKINIVKNIHKSDKKR